MADESRVSVKAAKCPRMRVEFPEEEHRRWAWGRMRFTSGHGCVWGPDGRISGVLRVMINDLVMAGALAL